MSIVLIWKNCGMFLSQTVNVVQPLWWAILSIDCCKDYFRLMAVSKLHKTGQIIAVDSKCLFRILLHFSFESEWNLFSVVSQKKKKKKNSLKKELDEFILNNGPLIRIKRCVPNFPHKRFPSFESLTFHCSAVNICRCRIKWWKLNV